jgi:hypothetical protein
MPYSLGQVAECLDPWPGSPYGSAPPLAAAPVPVGPAKRCSLLLFRSPIRPSSPGVGREPPACLHPVCYPEPSLFPSTGLISGPLPAALLPNQRSGLQSLPSSIPSSGPPSGSLSPPATVSPSCTAGSPSILFQSLLDLHNVIAKILH